MLGDDLDRLQNDLMAEIAGAGYMAALEVTRVRALGMLEMIRKGERRKRRMKKKNEPIKAVQSRWK